MARFTLLALLVAMATVATTTNAAPERRFLLDTPFKIMFSMIQKTWDINKAIFDKMCDGISDALDFDDAVDKLKPLINTDMSISACTSVCLASSAMVLGPLAPMSGSVCTPVCEGALAKLELAASAL